MFKIAFKYYWITTEFISRFPIYGILEATNVFQLQMPSFTQITEKYYTNDFKDGMVSRFCTVWPLIDMLLNPLLLCRFWSPVNDDGSV